jgi:SAM-dependent methyltransferase
MVRIVPPAHLLDRVCTDNDDRAKAQEFVQSGDRSVEELTRALEGVGRAFMSFSAVLDWGCGPGRVDLRLLERFPGIDLTGVDPDSGSIEWLSSLPISARFVTIGSQPPLPFGDESFDLVLNHSVLTHIDREAQRSWLAELARVTKEHGVLVCSVHGAYVLGVAVQDLRRAGNDPDRWLTEWGQSRFLFVEDDAHIGSAHHDGYHTTFQDPGTVEPLSSYWFEPLAFNFRGDLGFQDLLVFQKRSGEERTERVALASDPTESRRGPATSPVQWIARHAPGYRRQRSRADLTRATADLTRSWQVASVSLSKLGRQVARLENSVDRLERRISGASGGSHSAPETPGTTDRTP